MTEMLDDRPVADAADYTDVAIARSYGAALQAWSNAIAEASGYWGDAAQTPIALVEFWAIAKECVAAASLRAADERRNVVHVMSAFEARQWDVRVLFVCGMTDRNYPQRHAENLLFPDAEATRLGLGLRTARETDEEEAKLFPSLRSRARDLLLLSAPKRDTSGRGLVPSRFLLPSGDADATHSDWTLVRPVPHADAPLAGALQTLEAPTLLTQLAALHTTVGPTGLETLAQCKFQFFAKHALKLRLAPDPPEKRMNFLVQGNIMHDALKRWAEAGRPDILTQFEEAFDAPARRIESRRVMRWR